MSARLSDPRFLVFHAPLNGHLQDVSGYKQHMTWEGSGFGEGYQDNQFGIQAALLDGSASGDFLRHGVANFRSADTKGTITAWIMRSAVTGFPTIFASSDEATSSRFLLFHLRTAGQLSIERVNASGTDRIRGTTILTLDKWYHVIVVSNGTSWQLYVDGVAETLVLEAGANSGDWFADTPDRDNITIGNLLHFTPVIHFEGGLGDVRVYNIALTSDEAKKLFLQTVPRQVVAEQPIPQAPDLTDPSLLAAWLNKLTVNSGRDASPNGNDLTVHDDPIYEKVGTRFNGGHFRVSLGNPDFVGDLTICAWIQSNNQTQDTIFSYQDSDFDGIRLGHAGAGGLSWRYNIVNAQVANTVGTWQRIVGVIDKTLDEARLYVDGVLAVTQDITGEAIVVSINTRIGEQSFSPFGGPFDGQAREVEIYTEAKDQAWITRDFQKGVPDSSLVFQVLDGTQDLSRNRRALTLNGGVIVGRRMEFDGVDDSIEFPDEVLGATALTLVGWMNPKTLGEGSQGRLFYNGKVSFLVLATNRLRFTGDGGVTFANASDNSISLNRFMRVMVTRNAAGLCNFYVNGVLSGTPNQASGTPVAGTVNLFIGNRNTHDRTFDGSLADMRAYSEVKSSAFALEDYENTRKFY